MNRYLFLLTTVILFGCASSSTIEPLLMGTTYKGEPVCFQNPSAIPSIVARIQKSRDLSTEEGKIEYLLERVRASNLVFIRNGMEIDSTSASQFLRWKLNRLRKRHHMKIETAEDFVAKVASGSRMSGIPYGVIIPNDGGQYNLENVLMNELKALSACLADENKSEKQRK